MTIKKETIPGTLWSQEEKVVFKNYIRAVEGLAVKFHDYQFRAKKGETHSALEKKREHSRARTDKNFLSLRREFVKTFESMEERFSGANLQREKEVFIMMVEYSHEAEPRQALGDLKKIVAACDNQTILK